MASEWPLWEMLDSSNWEADQVGIRLTHTQTHLAMGLPEVLWKEDTTKMHLPVVKEVGDLSPSILGFIST
jgi:hypothetical protein